MKRFVHLLLLAMVANSAAAAADVPADGLWLDQARRMGADELANLILGRDHPPIRAATVRPIGMDAPSPWVTAVEFATVPGPGADLRFCEWQAISVRFNPVLSGTATPVGPRAARPAERTSELRVAIRPEDKACSALAVSGIAMEHAPLGTMRFLADLAAAQRKARSGERLPFPVTFEDLMADEIGDPDFNKLRSRRSALAWFPLTSSFAVVDGDSWLEDQKPPKLRPKENRVILLSENGSIAIYRNADFTITRIHVARYIPPPF